MRISDWSSDVCSSDLLSGLQRKSINSLVRLSRAPCSWVVSSVGGGRDDSETFIESQPLTDADRRVISLDGRDEIAFRRLCQSVVSLRLIFSLPQDSRPVLNQTELSSFRSEEHTSELQSLMRISYAVFCLKKTNYT